LAIRRYNPGYKPPVTLVLVGLNIAISLLDMARGGELERMFWARGIDIQYGDYWRLFTCGWVHASLMHLAFNAYGIYVLGSTFEQLHGWRPMLLVYLVSLLGGSALAMAFMDPAIPLVGASGAAYGLFGAVLGFFYARTGSVKALIQIPYARTLLLWLGFGVYMSLQPGISMLGHVGGFVPGVLLGVYFEHRYTRKLDLYHHLGVGIMALGIALLVAFACAPFTRASWYGARALRAFEAGEAERGDDLLQQAEKRRQRDEGTKKFIHHLRVWREANRAEPEAATIEVLRYPLTHPRGIGGDDGETRWFDYVRDYAPGPDALEGDAAAD